MGGDYTDNVIFGISLSNIDIDQYIDIDCSDYSDDEEGIVDKNKQESQHEQ